MANNYNMNQFKMKDQIGEVMNPAANVIQAVISTSLAAGTYVQAGQVVSFDTTAGDMPAVKPAAAGKGIGVIVFNERTNQYAQNMVCGIALDGSIITMSAAAAIARGAVVGYGSTFSDGSAIGVSTMGSGVGIGVALDIAATSTDIVRVLIKSGMAYNAAL
jgi:predicted RecA/RadA family phage recombinase